MRNARLHAQWIGASALSLALLTAAIAGGPVANHETDLPPALDAPAPKAAEGRVVQIALLLDTSNSMDGLIDQARAQLWNVVNDLAKLGHCCDVAECPGNEPVQLQIALYQYGNDRLESSDNFIELRAPFTTNLDIVSEQLFALRTKGGSEYCGAAIQRAGEELAWIAPGDEDGRSVMRLLVIAGNEPFSQGSVPYASAIETAINKGVTVHTVFCGPHATGESTFWAEGAKLGEGEYCSIDHNAVRVHIETPFDARISQLNLDLNGTYVAYGERGSFAYARQSDNDHALEKAAPQAAAARAGAKASALYRNASWDLVDALEEEAVDLDELEKEKLPEKYQTMSDEELVAAMDALRAKRRAIQKDLASAVSEQQQFIAEKIGEQADANTLGGALMAAIHRTGSKIGFIPESSHETTPNEASEAEK